MIYIYRKSGVRHWQKFKYLDSENKWIVQPTKNRIIIEIELSNYENVVKDESQQIIIFHAVLKFCLAGFDHDNSTISIQNEPNKKIE